MRRRLFSSSFTKTCWALESTFRAGKLMKMIVKKMKKVIYVVYIKKKCTLKIQTLLKIVFFLWYRACFLFSPSSINLMFTGPLRGFPRFGCPILFFPLFSFISSKQYFLLSYPISISYFLNYKSNIPPHLNLQFL